MNLILLIIFLGIFANATENKKNPDFFAGSVVKSDIWEIDRKNKIEYFKKNVFFKNYFYTIKSDEATYYKEKEIWNLKGNIYCKKMYENNSYLEIFSDFCSFFEYNNTAEFLSDGRLKLNFYDNEKNEKYIAYSKKIFVEAKKKIYFYDNFELIVSSITSYSNYAFYNDENKIFELTYNSYVTAYNEMYNVYLEAEKILMDRIKLEVTAERKVYGSITKR